MPRQQANQNRTAAWTRYFKKMHQENKPINAVWYNDTTDKWNRITFDDWELHKQWLQAMERVGHL